MKNSWLLLMLILIYSCKDKYVIPEIAPATGYLVVEGNINGGNTTTTIALSRTTTLTSNTRVYEQGATVSVEGKDGSSFSLAEIAAGSYSINGLNLDNNQTYRLHIKTSNGKEYLSDYVPVKTTPPIDSISWIRESDGVRIYVNAHDDAAKTRYYLWDFSETWEIHSAYLSVLDYDLTNPGQPTIRYIDSVTYSYVKDIYTCWVNQNSTTLELGSTAKLSQDKVYIPLVFIPNTARQLSVLYSMLVHQYALSKEAYEYLDKMRKNTESTGSIFDPQPAALAGNIHGVSDPNEMVIGYVNVSSMEEKRLWISKDEVPLWGYTPGCSQLEVQNQPDSVKQAYSNGYIPTTVAKSPGISSFYVTQARTCIDCTLSGSNIKPSFWP